LTHKSSEGSLTRGVFFSGLLLVSWSWIKERAAFVCAAPDWLALVVGFCKGRFNAHEHAVTANIRTGFLNPVKSPIWQKFTPSLERGYFVSQKEGN